MNREFPIDNFTPFLFILFLYDYHRLYDKKNNIDESLKLIFSTLNLIHKNHLKFYRRKRTKLLLRQYRKSDLEDRYNLEMFYPICQNLIMNSLWYKVNKMAQELTELSGNENRKLQRRTEKIRKKINSNLLKSFSQITVQNLQALSFTLHPMMIYTLTSPFPILTGRNGKKMFKILTDLFISSNGIVFPIRRDEQIHFLSSPILLYEFLDAWLEYFGNDDTLSNKFQKIAKNLSSALYEGMIGLMDGILERKNKDLYFSHSGLGLATTEAYVFLKRFQEVKLQKVS
jgi:hypothetical protein